MRRLTSLALIALLALTFVIGVSAQDATPEPTDTMDTEAATGMTSPSDADFATATEIDGLASYVRFVHLTEAVNNVDIYVNNDLSNTSNLGYEEFGVWTAVPAGTTALAVVPAGDPVDNAAIGPVDVNLAENTWNTVLVVPNAENQPTPVTIQQDFSSVAPTIATVYFVNALPSTTVNILRDGIPFYTSLANAANGNVQQASLPLDARTFNFSVTDATNDQPIGEEIELELDAGKVYVLAAVGTDENPRLVVDVTSPADVRLRNGELERPGSVVQVAEGEELLAPFLELVRNAGLEETLSGEGPYTLFAPADFVLTGAAEQFAGDSEALSNLLLNHVIEGEYDSGNLFLAGEGPFTSLAGNMLEITTTEEAGFINGQRILAVDNYGINGVIHLIDGLLDPNAEMAPSN
jgi:uncharacterized surface protein with fasciclin (FAS1) repeats